MRRLIAFEAEIDRFADRNVQVLGITADNDPLSLGTWGHEIGISFDLVADVGGAISRRFGLFSDEDGVTMKAVVIVDRGRIVHQELVEGTDVPESVYEVLAQIV